MSNWQEEAKFVLQKIAEENEEMFSNDNSEHSQRKKDDEFVSEWGFSYHDYLDLDKAIVMYILPRLAYFRENVSSYPDSVKIADNGVTVLNEERAMENWKRILDNICVGLHCYLEEDFDKSAEKQEKWKIAKKYLFDYFEHFWE